MIIGIYSEIFPKNSKNRRHSRSTVVLSCSDLSASKMAAAIHSAQEACSNKTEALRRTSKPGQIRGRFSDNFIATLGATVRIKLSLKAKSICSVGDQHGTKYDFHRAAVKRGSFDAIPRGRYVACVSQSSGCVSRYL